MPISLADEREVLQLIRAEAQFVQQNGGGRIRASGQALKLLASQLQGLPHADVSRLAHHAIADDGAITEEDIPALQQAKFDLLNQQGLLSFEFDTENLAMSAVCITLNTGWRSAKCVPQSAAHGGSGR